MQVVIIGAGKVGIALAQSLLERDDDVVLVEQNRELMQNAAHLACRKVTGVVIDEEVLRRADIEDADIVCAVTQNDNVNIMATLMARHLFQVERVVTRLYNPEKKRVFQELGLDTINSTAITVDQILRQIDGILDVTDQRLFGNDVHYSQVPVTAAMIGQPLGDIVPLDDQAVFGLLREGELLLRQPTLRLAAGDRIVLVRVN